MTQQPPPPERNNKIEEEETVDQASNRFKALARRLVSVGRDELSEMERLKREFAKRSLHDD